VKAGDKEARITEFKAELLKTWEVMPTYFYTSASSYMGKEELLNFIGETNSLFDKEEMGYV